MRFYHLTWRAPFNCPFRFYTWVKATDQSQAQATPQPTDLEALGKAKGDQFEADGRQTREKE